MNDFPNPNDFSVNLRAGEFKIRFRVRGEIEMTINADSLEDARAKAEAMIEEDDDDDFGLELTDVDDISISDVYPEGKLYRVLRDGRKMQVSLLKTGDQPREPDERGF
jgi:hypothetical protein